MKRFRQITVRAKAEPQHLIHLIGFSRQHHDRRVVSRGAHCLQHIITTHMFHHYVQDHQMELLFL